MKIIKLIGLLSLAVMPSLAAQHEVEPCISPTEKQIILQDEQRNMLMLGLDAATHQGRMMPPSIQGTLIWPMQSKDGLPDNDFKTWYVSNQVDLDMNIDTMPGDTAILDYWCGMRSYDNDPTASNPSGYNHDGTDIVIYPFPYTKMNENTVEVIAAATGVILSKRDTNVDRNCVWGTGRPSNNLTLLHEDGSKTRYIHLKQFSLTSKMVGDTIEQGEFIGIVGSSGNSTVPHLHFEVENASGQIIDPFFGPCSDTSLTDATWWADQPPYVDSALNKLMTYTTQPGNETCDMSDSSGVEAVFDERILFAQGDSVWYGIYFSHVDENDSAKVRIIRPDNSTLTEFDASMPGNFQKRRTLRYFRVLEGGAMTGLYTIRVTFMGSIYEHDFIVAECLPIYNLSGNVDTWEYWQASDWIHSEAHLLNDPDTEVTYKAGNHIELELGFEADAGAVFDAKIAACGNEGN